MKKLFILGIGGLTGRKLALLAKDEFEIYGTYNLRNPQLNFIKSSKLDITDKEKVNEKLLLVHPDFIVNACAINNVDYCETHQQEARKVNIDAVENISNFSESQGIKILHISSDSIFDGKKTKPYTENDVPNPINFYAYTKLQGEMSVLKNPNNLILRASVLYGWLPSQISSQPSSSMKPNNFAQWLISKLREKEKVKIITDEYSSPIIVDDFVRSIIHLLQGNYCGLFNSAPPIQITRYDFSLQLAKHLELDYNLIQPTTNKELGRKIATGENKCLDPTKIIKETNFNFLSLEKSFELLKKQCSQTITDIN